MSRDSLADVGMACGVPRRRTCSSVDVGMACGVQERLLAAKKKKAGKALKDPAAPKKPLSAFMIFSNRVREQVRKDNPGP